MILKKDLINGKMVYVEVNEDEARELYKENIILFFSNDDEKEDFYDKMADLDAEEEGLYDDEEDDDDDEDEKKSDNSRAFNKTDWKKIGEKAQRLSEEISRKVTEFTEKVINPDAFNIRCWNCGRVGRNIYS